MMEFFPAAWFAMFYAASLIIEKVERMTPKIKRACPKCGKMSQSCSCKKGKK